MEKKREIIINWEPQPRQLRCLEACGLDQPFTGQGLRPAIADIIGYGGSAGGGKTDTLLQIGIIAGLNYPKLNIAYFRREFPQLEGIGGAIQRSQELISGFCRYNEQKHRWLMPTKSVLQFFHCANPNDVYNYQSQQFDILLIDEVTQFEREMVKYLLTRNRATVSYPTFKPFACFATNPGNIGHSYFKEEFISLGEPEKVHEFINEVGEVEKHIFIPSRLDDNQILVSRDPNYRTRVGNTELNRKLLLEGNWDVFIGQAFNELKRDIHLIDPVEVPNHWRKFGALDYGYNHPFSYGVFTVSEDGDVYLIKYASDRLKRVDEIGEIISKLHPVNELSYIVAGHDCWSKAKGTVTIAEQFYNLPINYPGRNLPRIQLTKAKIDRVPGATQIREFIAWKGVEIGEDGKPKNGKPRFYIFRNCQPVYETLTRMIFDPSRPEDVLKVDADENGRGGDDDYDMTRYGLMSRPRPLPVKTKDLPKDAGARVLEEHLRAKLIERSYGDWR